MTWMLPPAMLPIAGFVALVVAWPRLRNPTSAPRQVAETFLIGCLTTAACAAAWALYWWIEQRW